MTDTTDEQKRTLVAELEELGAQMKQLEEDCPKVLDPNKWTVLRVDGHCFSTFTQRFKNRRDQRLIDAMLHAAEEWLREFNGVTCYVQSDEATLAIPPVDPTVQGATLIYGGRVSKIISLSAGFFSTKFNEGLPEEFKGVAYFDCRAFQVDSTELLRSAFRCRQLDAFRNGVSTAVRMLDYFKPDVPRKLIELYNTKQKLDLIKNHAKYDYSGDHLLHGTFIKKRKVNSKDYVRTKTERFVLGDDYVIKTPDIVWLTIKCLPDVDGFLFKFLKFFTKC